MDIKDPNSLTDSPKIGPDRLTTILAVLDPIAEICAVDDPRANLLVLGDEAPEAVSLLLGTCTHPQTNGLAAAYISFKGSARAMLTNAGREITIDLSGAPGIAALASVFASEAASPRCGGKAAMARLAEAILALLLRNAIETFSSTVESGSSSLLAGLSHPRLHLALVAMHDDPGAEWTSENLADVCGMSRSRFMASFRATLGQSPGAYLASWRMMLARDALAHNTPIKEVAHRLGYGSTAAFSRAFSRICGVPPSQASAVQMSAPG